MVGILKALCSRADRFSASESLPLHLTRYRALINHPSLVPGLNCHCCVAMCGCTVGVTACPPISPEAGRRTKPDHGFKNTCALLRHSRVLKVRDLGREAAPPPIHFASQQDTWSLKGRLPPSWRNGKIQKYIPTMDLAQFLVLLGNCSGSSDSLLLAHSARRRSICRVILRSSS